MSPDFPILPCPHPPPWLGPRPFHEDLYAMYSSDYCGIITDPLFMRVPVDDHLVHRGDGVFETLKCIDGRLYCLEEHLDRLFFSAGKIDLEPPMTREGLRRGILATLRAGGRRDALIRVLVSRGPGSMGINPSDCPQAGLYIVIHRLTSPFMELHPEGARVVTSELPVKPGIFATIKTCNYLPNAMLKKEATDRGADFAVNFDEDGHVAEGATENFGVVTNEGILIAPPPRRILAGTTLNRVFSLAETGIREGWLSGMRNEDITREALGRAAEILILGTTTNVTAVTRLDGHPVGPGKPGPVALRLDELLRREQEGDNSFTTPAFT